MKPGDAIVHHVLVAHGSKRNKTKRPRQGWTLQFKDKKSFYDKAAIAFYEKSLKKHLNLRGQKINITKRKKCLDGKLLMMKKKRL